MTAALRWAQPLRRRLPLLISALLAVVLGVFGWFANDRIYAAVEATASERLHTAAGQLADMLAANARTIGEAARTAAAAPALGAAIRSGAAGAEALDVLAAPTAAGGAPASRALWTAGCTLVAATGPLREHARCPRGDAWAAGTRAVGTFGSQGDSAFFHVRAPVLSGADTIGWLAGIRVLSASGAAGIEQLIGQDASLLLGNADGSLWTDLSRAAPGPGDPPVVGEPLHSIDHEGRRHFALARTVAGTPWMLLVQLPHEAVVEPARQLFRGLALAGLLCLLAGAAGAYYVSYQFTQPVEEIARAARGIAGGDYAQRVHVHRSDELGHLADTFNSMAVQVEAASDELHAQALELEEQMQDALEARRSTATVTSLLDDVLASAPVGMAVFDARLRYVRANATLAELNAWPAEAHIGNTPAQVEPHMGALLEPLLHRVRDTGQTIANEQVVADLPGRARRHWLVTVFPVRDLEGDVASVGLVVLDTTAHQELEAQFLQAQKMEAVGRLAGGVAHDFNNVLTVIMSYSEMALGTLEPGTELHGDMQEIRNAASRAAALTGQLLAFSRNQVMQPQVLDLNEVARGMERMLRRLIGEDVALVLELAPSLHDVRADPGQVEQVIMNLAINARDAMPEGGRLVIGTMNEDDRAVLLTVRDTGVGMSEDVRQHVFEPFFTTKAAGKGTGLGMSTVYGIVQQSGGTIVLDSAQGRGTVVTIRLPRVDDRERAPRAHAANGSAPAGAGTVLLVEDDVALRALARRVLDGAGYTVLEARTSEEALELGRTHPGTIDLLLTDVVMPGLNGRAVAEALHARRPSLRVLYMSGYTDDEVVRRGVSGERIALLQKPFTPQQLAARVGEVMRG